MDEQATSLPPTVRAPDIVVIVCDTHEYSYRMTTQHLAVSDRVMFLVFSGAPQSVPPHRPAFVPESSEAVAGWLGVDLWNIYGGWPK